MKKLLILAITLTSFFAHAEQAVMDFYTGNFELVEVAPMCPPSVPNGASCMAIGSIITVKSYAGCLGKKAFFDAQVKSERGLTKIYITSLIQTNLDMERRVRCIKVQEVVEKIIAPMHIGGQVEIINQEIHQ
mgnify:CR=1 FL=1|tara:strand:+ start:75073 stop:75468 length:396 start_codon:yes stop_codon:yes gene_type:complete